MKRKARKRVTRWVRAKPQKPVKPRLGVLADWSPLVEERPRRRV